MTTLSIDPFPLLDDLPLPSMVRSAQFDALDGLRRQAFVDGHRAGFEEGRAEGRARGASEAQAELAAQIDALAYSIGHAADAAVGAVGRQDAVTGHSVIELALQIAELVLGRELAVAEDPGRDALVRALAAAPDRGEVVARLHPDDAAVVERRGSLTEVAGARAVTLVPDPAVGRGGCVLDVGGSRIDARMDAAIERVRAVLLGAPEAASEALS